MTEMADDQATTPAEDTAGNQEKTEGEAQANDASPFLGKIAPTKPTVNLTGGVSPANLTPDTAPSPVPKSEAEKTTPSAQSAVDAMFSGNAILAAEEALKKPEPADTKTRPEPVLTPFETPVMRSQREIGVSPRLAKKAAAPEPAPPHSAAPRIRTYAMDMSDEIRKRGETLASIVNTEKQQTVEAPSITPEMQRRIALFAGGALILIALGVMAIGGAILLNQNEEVAPVTRSSLIPANAVQAIDPGASLEKTLAEERENSTLNLGEIEELIPVQDGAAMTPGAILSALGAPDALSRNASRVMVGVHAFDRNQPFILVSTGSYDISFQAMLEWEAEIADNMKTFFKPTRAISATPPPVTFTDRVFQNIDMRESGDEWPIVYAFIRRDLLIITTNENTIREVLTRLSLSSGN